MPGAGWDDGHVCIDNHSGVGLAQIHPDETGATVTVFLRAAIAYFRDLGVYVTGVMIDNGGGYRSRVFQQGCARLGLRHLYTLPYTPRTNGKAERFIQTALREWAYARAYRTSGQRAAHLMPWLHRTNVHLTKRSAGRIMCGCGVPSVGFYSSFEVSNGSLRCGTGFAHTGSLSCPPQLSVCWVNTR